MAGRALLIAGGALLVMGISYGAWSYPWDHTRAMVFTTLALAQLFYAFALRGRRTADAGSRLLGNRWLVAGVFGGALLQVGASLWAPTRALLGIEWLSAADWSLVGAAALVPSLIIFALAGRPRGSRAS